MSDAIGLLDMTAFLAALTLPAAAVPSIGTCPHDGPWVSVVDVQAALAARSVDIVTRAAGIDDAALGRLVAPTATFTIWSGDVGWGPRGTARNPREDLRGPAAARAFADHIAVTSFEFAQPSAGLIATDPCGRQSVVVTFENTADQHAYVIRFDYLGGRLIAAEGSLAMLMRGTLR